MEQTTNETTETTYWYSPSANVFLPIALRDVYEENNSWPADSKPIPDEFYEKYTASPPEGKIRGCGSDGLPAWVEHDAKIDPVNYASYKKKKLLTLATNVIEPLRDAVDNGIATEAESALLKDWQIFRVYVNRIDPAEGENITWPVPPDSTN